MNKASAISPSKHFQKDLVTEIAVSVKNPLNPLLVVLIKGVTRADPGYIPKGLRQAELALVCMIPYRCARLASGE